MTDTAEAGVSGQIGHCLPEELLHLFHPFAFLWVALVGFLVILGSVDLQRIFLKFGPCPCLGWFGKISNTLFYEFFKKMIFFNYWRCISKYRKLILINNLSFLRTMVMVK